MRILDKIITNEFVIIFLSIISLILSGIHLWRTYSYESFSIVAIEDGILVDIKDVNNYMTIRPVDDQVVGMAEKPIDSDEDIKREFSSRGVDFGSLNKTHRHLTITKDIRRELNVQRKGSSNILFDFTLRSQLNQESLSEYIIILGASSGIRDLEVNDDRLGFIFGSCEIDLHSSDEVKFSTSPNIPNAILIGVSYDTNITFSFEMKVDCK